MPTIYLSSPGFKGYCESHQALRPAVTFITMNLSVCERVWSNVFERFFFFFLSLQQFHQAGEPVFHLHKHMAHSCWIHTFGKWTDVRARWGPVINEPVRRATY